MEQHFHQVTTESKVIHTFTNFYMHEFIEKSKKKTAEGNCLILQWRTQQSTGPIYYLKMNNFEFCKRINQSIFIKVQYLRSTSYIFFNEFDDNLVYAVSMPNLTPDLEIFEEVLIKNGILTDYLSPDLKYQVKVRINFHINQVLQNEIIINFNKSAKIAKVIGGFFGKINNSIVKKAAEAQTKLQDQMKRVSRQSFSDATRSKWDKFVQKASNLNERLTQIVKPLNETISNTVNTVGQKYNNSNNGYLKAVREFTKEAQNSINEGYYNVAQLPKANSEDKPPVGEDSTLNMMGQNLILNEQVEAPEKSPYPEV